MPAFNYQPHFVPYVEEGSKTHTIRARRKNPAKVGDMLYHYEGIRTKRCRLIRKDICTEVKTIHISKTGAVYIFHRRLTDIEVAKLALAEVGCLFFQMELEQKKVDYLSEIEKDQLAWLDGFGRELASLEQPKLCFNTMLRWWTLTHQLPFVGDIIYW